MKRFIFCILFSLTSICNAASIQATCGEFTGHIAIENSSGQIELNKTTVNGVYHFSYNENVATETFIPNKKLRDITNELFQGKMKQIETVSIDAVVTSSKSIMFADFTVAGQIRHFHLNVKTGEIIYTKTGHVMGTDAVVGAVFVGTCEVK